MLHKCITASGKTVMICADDGAPQATQLRSRAWAKLLSARGVDAPPETAHERDLERAAAQAFREHRQRVLCASAFGAWRAWATGAIIRRLLYILQGWASVMRRAERACGTLQGSTTRG